MRKNFGAKPILYPMPVLILGTYDETGHPDAKKHKFPSASARRIKPPRTF